MLGANQLTGSIPSALGNLTNLIYLLLYDNHLSGEVPSEITNLINLLDEVGLDLRYNCHLIAGDPLVAEFINKKNRSSWVDTQNSCACIGVDIDSDGKPDILWRNAIHRGKLCLVHGWSDGPWRRQLCRR